MVSFAKAHHVALIVSDYQRSKQFYTEVLGLKVLKETLRAERRSYKLDLEVPGGLRLELFSFPDPPARPTEPEAAGLRHLAFAVVDLAAAAADLNVNGVATEPVRIDEVTGARFTFFRDPDGLPLELYEVTPKWLCPTCRSVLTEMSACGSTQYFCEECRSLVSRSKRIAEI
jgi:glyoxylase I family protein